ncbi:uncharacterized protein LOC135626034 [Musa acuminata AAA Group]|uniref:uncharacterized protein LOC135626034 n=1 Tax=Musa acuminata AAA Group TaxID=214697 RepID=UPI0031D6BE29
MSRFLARSGDRCLPFFRALKNPKNFRWTTKCEEAFKQMKQHLASLPRLASVSPGERLGLYLAASQHAVSSVLVKENSGEQLPVYYVNHVLSGPEERYPPIEKLSLTLVLSVRKLRPYFQAHPVEVITDQPLRQILLNLMLQDAFSSGRWSSASMTSNTSQTGISSNLSKHGSYTWTDQPTQRAPVQGLRLALEMQVAAIHVLTDSQLVAEQLSGGYEARDPTMAKYLAQVRNLTTKFPHFTLSNVPREENERAEALAKLASRPAPEARPEVEELPARAIEIAVAASGSAPTTWVQELLRFKRDGILPPDEVAVRRLRRTHAWYSEWGLDLLGPFPPASGQRKYIIVGVDYFTKWVEVEPLATIMEHQIERFVWRNLVTWFGLPKTIITDNGPQFAGRRFREFCTSHGIQLRFSSVAYP